MASTDCIRKVVIVGGGTAGWMSALYLIRLLKRGGPAVAVQLVESSAIGIIGVGEATVPTLRRTLQGLGLVEREWMVACNASFKLGIHFVDWSAPPAPASYWHPFMEEVPLIAGLPVWQSWLYRWLDGKEDALFAESCVDSVELCQRSMAPKWPGLSDYQGAVTYAYHFDTALLGAYLKEKAIAAGVDHVVDDVVGVELDDRNYILSLATAKTGRLEGDLFIDCTGFRGRLINEALGEPFESFSDCLFCDRALAVQVPTGTEVPIRPYTTATALDAGWVWDIPLYDRRGVGYVYASNCLSEDEVERQLFGYLGMEPGELELRRLRMRVGRTRRAWVNNCVAIGLSAGFVEPLESTGIFLIEVGLQKLWESFPDRHCDVSLRERYNRAMSTYTEDVRDFIVLHYCLSRRRDTEFWRANGNPVALPDSLKAKLERWTRVWPMVKDVPEPRLFSEYSYVCILSGMDCLPPYGLPILGHEDPRVLEEGLALLEDRRRVVRNQLPTHRDYLRQMRSTGTSRPLWP